MAMNGWADGEPAWWLNLQAHPDASVDLADGSRAVRARAAEQVFVGDQQRARGEPGRLTGLSAVTGGLLGLSAV
jgi:hypothetical protein